MRCLSLILIVAVAGCARTRPPPPPVAVTVAPPTVAPRPPWVARRVVPAAVDIRAGTLTVAAGEDWARLAARAGVPAGALIAANPGPPVPGRVLKVPPGRVHTVAGGETGIAIARAYGANWSRVIAANRLTPPYVLEIGDRLLLPSRAAVAAMSVEDRARAFKIDIDDLITGGEPAVTGGTPATVRVVPRARPPRPATVAAKPPPVVAALPPVAGAAPQFAWPVEGRILSGFGAKPGGRYNDGVNLKALPGTPVRAAADGVVAYAGDAVAGFGNLLLIKHADGWVSAYAHNAALLVARGARVAKGDVVARTGATGAVDEPQLHFELRRGRVASDPVKLLPARG